ncbi:MAG: site-specific integrase [Methylovulum sp.]|nr:MAG: site-specific integrase [Methylovulum sp.]
MNNETTSPQHVHQYTQSCNVLTLYLDNLAPSGRRSMRSLLQQVAMMQGWSGELELMPWMALRYEHIAGIRAALRHSNKSPNTINTTLAALRGVLKAGFLSGQFPALEWQRIQAIDRIAGKNLPAGRQLPSAEINRLFAACERDPVNGIRDAAILTLLAYAGLRRSELTSLNLADYETRTGVLIVREGKGQRQREMSLPMLARPTLRRWLHCRGHQPGALFCQLAKNGEYHPAQRITAHRVYGILADRAKQAGIAHCSPHDLRRTFVTRLLEQGVDFNTASQLAGHENIQTTALYDRRHVKAQRQAMANFHF